MMFITEFPSRLPAFACALGLTSATVLISAKGAEAQTTKPAILLVHGAWADSSSWNGVIDRLLKDGYDVRALPNTLRGLEADAAVISTYLKTVSQPVVLVGHSYGGSVISVASANAPNVKALVYVDAFAPEAGESLRDAIASAPPPPADFTIAVPFATPTGSDADLYINAKYFGPVFASAESPEVAARLAATQRPFAARCMTDKAPAAIGWKTIPSWYVLGDADMVLPPDIQQKFATRAKSKVYHVPGGDHPSMIAHPEVTVAAIEDAANTVAH
jgi:pimeloyl-ACP methyl ester carboxylesterase